MVLGVGILVILLLLTHFGRIDDHTKALDNHLKKLDEHVIKMDQHLLELEKHTEQAEENVDKLCACFDVGEETSENSDKS